LRWRLASIGQEIVINPRAMEKRIPTFSGREHKTSTALYDDLDALDVIGQGNWLGEPDRL
jgi:hypothetical protein